MQTFHVLRHSNCNGNGNGKGKWNECHAAVLTYSLCFGGYGAYCECRIRFAFAAGFIKNYIILFLARQNGNRPRDRRTHTRERHTHRHRTSGPVLLRRAHFFVHLLFLLVPLGFLLSSYLSILRSEHDQKLRALKRD